MKVREFTAAVLHPISETSTGSRLARAWCARRGHRWSDVTAGVPPMQLCERACCRGSEEHGTRRLGDCVIQRLDDGSLAVVRADPVILVSAQLLYGPLRGGTWHAAHRILELGPVAYRVAPRYADYRGDSFVAERVA